MVAIGSLHVTNPVAVCAAGLLLGVISVFLGIGGGPLNVACMSLLFSYGMKESTVYSLATIFFSQLSKLGTNALVGTLFAVDLSFVPAVVLPAVVGGFLGTQINQRASDETVRKVYVGMSCFNCARGLGLVG